MQKEIDNPIVATQEVHISGVHDGISALLEILFNHETLTLHHKDLPYRFGREAGLCDLYVPAVVASRQHCVIKVEEGRLGILDSSRNGTFLKIGQANEIKVHNEFYPLVGKGMFKLGESVQSGAKNIFYYRCIE